MQHDGAAAASAATGAAVWTTAETIALPPSDLAGSDGSVIECKCCVGTFDDASATITLRAPAIARAVSQATLATSPHAWLVAFDAVEDTAATPPHGGCVKDAAIPFW